MKFIVGFFLIFLSGMLLTHNAWSYGTIDALKYADTTKQFTDSMQFSKEFAKYKIYFGSFIAPLKQLEHGISPYAVQCNEGFELLFKSKNSPACVTPDTKKKLIQRGWGLTKNQLFGDEETAPSLQDVLPTIIFPKNATGHAPQSWPIPEIAVLWLGTNGTVSLINESENSVNLVFGDDSAGDEVSVGVYAIIQFNQSGFYEYTVYAPESFPRSGSIVVLGENLNSLDLDERLKMAEAMVNKHLQGLSIIGFASVNQDKLLEVTIDETEAEKIPNAKDYYTNMINDVIPFEVPTSIEIDSIIMIPS